MHYTRISADCHIDMPWMPARPVHGQRLGGAARTGCPTSPTGPTGPYWTCKNGTSFGLVGGVGPVGAEVRPRAELPRRRDGRDRALRGRQEGHPPRHRSAPARQGHGARRRQAEVIFGILGAATRLNDHEAANEMFRIYNDWLVDFCQPLSGPAHRPGLPALRRHRRGGEGDPPRGEDGAARPRAVVLVGHGAHVASRRGSRSGRR